MGSQASATGHHIVEFAAHWGRSGAVIGVTGELDATNAGQLTEYVARCATNSEWLVVDLSGLKFIGAAGLSALQQIDAGCARADVHWALVPGASISGLLGASGTALPTAESVSLALARVQPIPAAARR